MACGLHQQATRIAEHGNTLMKGGLAGAKDHRHGNRTSTRLVQRPANRSGRPLAARAAQADCRLLPASGGVRRLLPFRLNPVYAWGPDACNIAREDCARPQCNTNKVGTITIPISCAR